jgi:hypothetical protein
VYGITVVSVADDAKGRGSPGPLDSADRRIARVTAIDGIRDLFRRKVSRIPPIVAREPYRSPLQGRREERLDRAGGSRYGQAGRQLGQRRQDEGTFRQPLMGNGELGRIKDKVVV